jgi:hypothetical protein
VLVEIVGLAVVYSSLPKPAGSAADLHQFLVQHQGALRIHSLNAGLVSILLLWYAVTLGSFLRQGNDIGGLGLLAVAGGAAQAVLHWVAATVLLLFPSAVTAWSDVDLRVPVGWMGVYLTFLAYPAIAFAGAAGVRVVQTRLLPIWLGWLGIGVALAELVTVVGGSLARSGSLANGGTFGLLSFALWMLWILATSIALTRCILADGVSRR